MFSFLPCFPGNKMSTSMGEYVIDTSQQSGFQSAPLPKVKAIWGQKGTRKTKRKKSSEKKNKNTTNKINRRQCPCPSAPIPPPSCPSPSKSKKKLDRQRHGRNTNRVPKMKNVAGPILCSARPGRRSRGSKPTRRRTILQQQTLQKVKVKKTAKSETTKTKTKTKTNMNMNTKLDINKVRKEKKQDHNYRKEMETSVLLSLSSIPEGIDPSFDESEESQITYPIDISDSE